MDSIVISSDGTPHGTEIKTKSGHVIHGITSLSVYLDVTGPAKAEVGILMPDFSIEIKAENINRQLRYLVMAEHNRREIERAGISRIH